MDNLAIKEEFYAIAPEESHLAKLEEIHAPNEEILKRDSLESLYKNLRDLRENIQRLEHVQTELKQLIKVKTKYS